MNRGISVPTLALFIFALLGGCTTLVSNEARELRYSSERAGTQIVVTVPSTATQALSLVGPPGQSYGRRRDYGLSPTTDRTLQRIAREYRLKRVRGWEIDSIGVYCEVFEVAEGRDADEVIAALLADPRVDLAQRMNTFETLATRYNDPFADLQTSVEMLAVESAHSLATGRGITVAVVDSQVDTRHPELRNSIRLARDLVDSGLLREAEAHGTAVAGVIASAANNTEGIVGIAPDVSIAALRACWAIAPGRSESRCSSFSIAQALEAALQIDADIINMSLAGPDDPLLGKLLDEALMRGKIIVAARDAHAGPHRGFPASHPGVIAAEIDRENFGNVDPYLVGAPGIEILTTAPEAGYAFYTGNSLAAAHVSGVAALLLEKDPTIDAPEIVRILNDTAIDDGSTRSINACRALALLVANAHCFDPPPPFAQALDGAQ